LNQPTFRAANVAEATGAVNQVKINEWLTAGVNPYPDDFVELYNPQTLPVNVGGTFLTDQPVGDQLRSPIAALSFIGPRGYLVFTSGNGNTADEINFGLASEQGEIALRGADGRAIDAIVYGPQQLGLSQGRCADGEASFKRLVSPTPGGPNECPFVAPPPQTIQLVAWDHAWRYDNSGADLGTAWTTIDYNDTTWPEGAGPLGNENAVLIEPIRTTIALGPRTFYFRTRFNVDPNLIATSLQLSLLIDDGAAFYLNGQEINGTRYNLPAGAAFNTPANSSIDNANLNVVTAAAALLQPGVNTLAVELHQPTGTSGDIVFGLKLDAKWVLYFG
jgi:hypothetical protein